MVWFALAKVWAEEVRVGAQGGGVTDLLANVRGSETELGLGTTAGESELIIS